MTFKKNMSLLLVFTFIMSMLFQTFLWNSAFAEDSDVYYSQDFGTVESTIPSGWSVPKGSSYIQFSSSTNAPSGAMEDVSDVAINAVASGSGNRAAYVDIDPDILIPENIQYVTIDFDFYMNGGVNTCNILTIGNGQSNSYTDLSKTFFALGNGDGVGARNTLRYYDYNIDSWVSIADVNEEWLHAQLYVDMLNKKMAFSLKDSNGISIGTYGPFSFASKFTDSECCLSRIDMSAFRTNGGTVTLNTWLDNFKLSATSDEHINLLAYNGILPKGVLGTDYTLIENNGEVVCKTNNILAIDDVSTDQELIRVISTDVMITELPSTGYQTIFSFDDDANGNLLIGSKGQLFKQLGSGTTDYSRLFRYDKKLQVNKWYNIQCYVFMTTSTETAQCTYIVTGDFGNGTETLKTALETRNSDKFNALNLTVGKDVLFKNTCLSTKERPDISYVFDSSKTAVIVDGSAIKSGATYEKAVPQQLRIGANTGYSISNFYFNDQDITSELHADLISGGYRYILPLQDEDVTISITNGTEAGNMVVTTQEDEPYSLDPSQSWDVRKYASESRTIQIKDVKMAYRLYKPVGYDEDSNEKYPLVISLRAKGDESAGFDNTPPSAGHVEDMLTRGQNATDFPCFILSPQCYDETWEDDSYNNVGMVLEIADVLLSEFDSIDKNRIYIGGLSDGGCATWLALTIRPDFFAGSYIMSGKAFDTELAEIYVNTPIWAFYALDDSDAGVPRTNKAMVEAIAELGGEVINTEYETGGHIITWQDGLQSPIFQWLFSKEKGTVVENTDIDRLILDYNNSVNCELNIDYNLNDDISNSECTIKETVLGDLVTDAMREYTGADIAVINGSDLGTGITAGEVSEEDILSALPVKLRTSVVELKGSDIQNLLVRALTAYPNADDRFLQVSGLTIDFDPEQKPSSRITSVMVNGEALDSEQTYNVAITSHLLSNKLSGTYDGTLKIVERNYQLVSQMFVSYLNEHNYNSLEILTNRINALTN